MDEDPPTSPDSYDEAPPTQLPPRSSPAPPRFVPHPHVGNRPDPDYILLVRWKIPTKWLSILKDTHDRRTLIRWTERLLAGGIPPANQTLRDGEDIQTVIPYIYHDLMNIDMYNVVASAFARFIPMREVSHEVNVLRDAILQNVRQHIRPILATTDTEFADQFEQFIDNMLIPPGHRANGDPVKYSWISFTFVLMCMRKILVYQEPVAVPLRRRPREDDNNDDNNSRRRVSGIALPFINR